MNHTRIVAAILAALTLAAALASCESAPSSPSAPTDTAADTAQTSPDGTEKEMSDYFVVPVRPDLSETYLYKINVRTGAYINLCSDPLCSHNTEDCPFYGAANGLAFSNKYVWFMLSDVNGGIIGVAPDAEIPEKNYNRIGLYRCDPITGVTEKIIAQSEDGSIPYPSQYYYPCDDCVFFYWLQYPYSLEEIERMESEGSDIPEPEKILCRYTVDTKEMTEFGKVKDVFGIDDVMPEMVSYDESTVTWSTAEKQIVTNYNMNILTEIPLTTDSGEYITFYGDKKYIQRSREDAVAPEGYKSKSGSGCDLYMIGESGEEKLIAENIATHPLYIGEKDMFIFRKIYGPEDDNIMYTPDGTDGAADKIYYNSTKNEIWAMNADGTDQYMLCRIEDPYLEKSWTRRFFLYSGAPKLVSDCILVSMGNTYIDPQGGIDPETGTRVPGIKDEDISGYAVVNIVTGEYKVVYPDGDPQTCASRDLSAEIKK